MSTPRDLLPFDAAIVDLDGTLIDTLGDFAAALNFMLRDLHYAPVSRADIEPLVGKGSEHLVAQVLARQHHTRKITHTLGAGYIQVAAQTSYQRHYARINGQFSSVYPGVLEGLQLMRAAGLSMACVTNKPGVFARALLSSKGLDFFFSHVFGGDAFAHKKPHPMPLLKACEAMGARPARTLMVGDSSNDAKAAQAASCPLALVTYGYNHGEPIGTVPALAHWARLDEVAQFLSVS